jgi:hypothetical protein
LGGCREGSIPAHNQVIKSQGSACVRALIFKANIESSAAGFLSHLSGMRLYVN